MTKKTFSMLLAACLVFTIIPLPSLAATGQGEGSGACICAGFCAGTNAECPVCAEDYALCAHFTPPKCICTEFCNGQKPECPACVQHPALCDYYTPPAACICAEKCAGESVNPSCTVCAADGSACTGTAPAPADDPSDDPAEDPAACICTEECAGESVNPSCPACAADGSACAGAAVAPAYAQTDCTCAERCYGESVNPSCSACAADVYACAAVARTTATPEDFANYTVPSQDPPRVTLHLFDYWLSDDRFADDMVTDNLGDVGINEDHILRFRSSGGYMTAEDNVTFPDYGANQTDPDYKILSYGVNHGTSEGTDNITNPILRPRQGIVHPILGDDKYPKLNYSLSTPSNYPNLELKDPNYSPDMFKGFGSYSEEQKKESLAYLFNPAKTHAGKKSFANVSGLFRQDENGFYYYNSTGKAHDGYIDSTTPYEDANYAWFDEDANRFVLYEEHGVDSSEALGQFFPFDGPEHVFTIEDGKLAHKQADSFTNTNGATAGPASNEGNIVTGIRKNHFDGVAEPYTFNHYFGIYLEIPFTQAVGGQTYYNGAQRDTTFHFSGDDDLWLFVDNVLVGDVGGIHGISTLDINFATGDVVVNADTPGTNDVPGTQVTTLKQIYAAAKDENPDANVELNPDPTAETYADGSYHTIRVFYMERGNSASNLGIKFNVPTMPLSEIKKTDEDGNALPGAEFELVSAVRDEDGNYSVNTSTPTTLKLGSTDSEGKLTLLNEDDTPLLISSLPGEHFILRETTVPEGYRSPGDMHLVKHRLGDGSVVLISDPESPTGSKWNTGSYASAVETASVKSPNVYLRQDSSPYNADTNRAVVQNGNLVGLGGDTGTMFAIVLKWTNGRPSPSSNLSDHYNGTPFTVRRRQGISLRSWS